MSTSSWSILEKLLLAQAVYKYGEDNWFQVARNLKHHALLDRPSDYFNQKNCSHQYYSMVEELNAENRNTLSNDMPVVVQLARQLYALRLEELKKAINEDEEKFLSLISEIDDIRAGKWDNQLLGLPPSTEPTPMEVENNKDTDKLASSSASTPQANAIEKSPSQQHTSSEEQQQDQQDQQKEQPPKQLAESQPEQQKAQQPEQQQDIQQPVKQENQQQEQPAQPIDSAKELEKLAEEDIVKEEKAKVEAENLENETRDVRKEDVPPIIEHMDESVEQPMDLTIPPSATEAIEAADLKATKDTTEDIPTISVRADQPKEIVSSKRQADEHEVIEAPEFKRQRMEDPITDLSEPSPVASADVSSLKRQILHEDEPLTIDTARNDYSTDVSRGTTPADTREGTESIAGSESNAATPTNERGRRGRDDQRQKSWLKNINLLWREIANHKNGAMFMNPIKENIAPHYYEIVKRPMDLKAIKNRIRDGLINTTTEFERDVVLMLNNSLMYNKEGTEVYQLAKEMLDDAVEQIKTFRMADTDSAASSHTRAASIAAKAERKKSVAPE